MLPNVKITFANGAIGGTAPSDDGVAGLVSHAEAVPSKFTLSTPYLLTALKDLVGLGITSASTGANALVYRTVKEFYDEAPNGTKLWLMGVATSVSLATLTNKTNNHISPLLEAAGGAIKILAVKTQPVVQTPTMTGSISEASMTAVGNLQALAEEWTNDHYAPMVCLVEGQNYNGTPAGLPDLSERTDNRVAVVLGDTEGSSNGAAVGLVAGRLAASPVQRCLARVRDGAISAEKMYLKDVLAELGSPEVAHDKGYIVPRTFVGKSGYFWSDDKTATSASDDYGTIARVRTINKAYRTAYKTMLEEVGEEVDVDAEGKLAPSYCKGIETSVESDIVNTMTSEGNLGNDPEDGSDLGVTCYVNPEQNILGTSRLEVQLRVKPKGYSKYIDVDLGFKTTR